MARDPADVLISAEIQALMRKQSELGKKESFHRSAMIDAQVEQMKLDALIDRYRDALARLS